MLSLEKYIPQDCKLQAGVHLLGSPFTHAKLSQCLHRIGSQQILAEQKE